MKNKLIGWTFDFGFFTGLLLGIRTYEKELEDEEYGYFKQINHVLYFLFIDFNIELIYKNAEGK